MNSKNPEEKIIASSQEADLSSPPKKSDSLEFTKSSLTLAELLVNELLIQEELNENEDSTEENLIKWEENHIELRDKLDAYGYVITELSTKIDSLNTLRDKISSKQSSISKNIGRIKERLYRLSNGKALRGSLFSFLPYISKTRTVALDKLSEDEIYVTVELKLGDWYRILNQLDESNHVDGKLDEMARDLYGVKELKRRGKVSELPIDHPAIIYQEQPSVRIT